MKKTLTAAPKILAAALLLAVWIIILAKAFSRLELNSDMAGMVIEANEIISGNIFLKGRALTSLTFIPTDLLFFVIAALFFGVSGKTYISAVILMYLTAYAAALLNLRDIDKTTGRPAFFLLLTFTGFPCAALCGFSDSHMGCFAWCMFAAYFLNKTRLTEEAKVKRRCCIAALLFMTMACMGDMLAYLAIILPVLAFSAVRIFKWLYDGAREKPDRFSCVSAAAAVGAAVLGKVLEKIYMTIGGAGMKGYVGSRAFIDIDEFRDKWLLFIDGIAHMFGADFFGREIFSSGSLVAFVKFFVVAAVVVSGAVYSVKLCFGTDGGYASGVLGLGFVILSAPMLLTNFSVDIYTTRYFVHLPFVSAIWSAEWLSRSGAGRNKAAKCALTVLCSAFIICGAMDIITDPHGRWFTLQPYTSGKEKVAEKIEELGLSNGYADYWEANYLTVASEGNIKVNSVTNCGEGIMAQYWFSAFDDYKEYTNFVVCNDTTFTEEMARTFLGEPQRTEAVSGYKIMVYDHDLSEMILL